MKHRKTFRKMTWGGETFEFTFDELATLKSPTGLKRLTNRDDFDYTLDSDNNILYKNNKNFSPNRKYIFPKDAKFSVTLAEATI